MKTWVKVLLGVIALVVLSCGLIIGGAVYWVDKNKGAIKEKGEKVMAEAKAFAATHEASECVTEAFRRQDADDGFLATVETKIFLEHCAEEARNLAALCADVPPASEIMKTVTWSVARCADMGRADDQQCAQLIRALQGPCHKKPATELERPLHQEQ